MHAYTTDRLDIWIFKKMHISSPIQCCLLLVGWLTSAPTNSHCSVNVSFLWPIPISNKNQTALQPPTTTNKEHCRKKHTTFKWHFFRIFAKLRLCLAENNFNNVCLQNEDKKEPMKFIHKKKLHIFCNTTHTQYYSHIS
jgi:hypothetical protein